MLFKKFQQLAQWVGFLAIAGLALYGLVTMGSGRLWAAENESPSAETDAPQVVIPSMFNYQGFLRDAQGNAMNGTHKITVSLWTNVDSTNVAALLHTEEFLTVSVRDGLFNVVIGSNPTIPSNVFVNNQDIFVGIKVDDSTEELLPRQRFYPVPWALLSATAQNATTATNATNAATATTLVSGAAVNNIQLNGITKFGAAGSTAMQESGGKIYFTGGTGLYVAGDATVTGNINVTGKINGEKPPMVFTVGMNTNTTQYWTTAPIDIGPLCGDADGCTMRFLFRIKSTDEIRVIEDMLFIEQPGESGNKNAGLNGFAMQHGGTPQGFVLNTAGKFPIVPDPWNWIRVRNHTQIVNGTVADGPVLTGYNVTFMTVPDVAATVIIYDR